MKKKLTEVTLRNGSVISFDASSYTGGQLLIGAVALTAPRGKKRPRKIWHKGSIQSIQVDDDYLVVTLDWVATLRGHYYFWDESYPCEIRIQIIDYLESSEKHSLKFIRTEDGMKEIYCFIEPDHGSMLDSEKIRTNKK